MCGLYGLITEGQHGFDNVDRDVQYANGWINQLRGAHSSGIVTVMNDQAYAYMKETGGLWALTGDKFWDEMWKDAYKRGTCQFGHGRFATKGNVTQANAHPFIVGEEGREIIFMHNGTLANFQRMPDFDKFAVDSEWLANMVYTYGYQALQYANGAMAVMWYDQATGNFHVFRNDERPLHFATYGGKVRRLLINSEREALIWLKHKFKLPFEEKDIHPFNANHLYTLDIANVSAGFKRTLLPKKYNWGGKEYDPPVYENRGNVVHLPASVPGVTQAPFAPTKTSSSESGVAVVGGVVAPTTRSDRSFLEDVLKLLSGEYKEVQFNPVKKGKTKRFTRLADETLVCDEVEIYDEDLYSLTKGGPNLIRKMFAVPGVERYQAVDVHFDALKVQQIIKEVREHMEAEQRPKGFGQSTKMTWTSKSGLKHKGRTLPNSLKYFSDYENDKDGTFALKDAVMVEVMDIVPAIMNGVEQRRVYARRLKAGVEDDVGVTFTFNTSKYTEEDLIEIGNWAGDIVLMRQRQDDDPKETLDMVIQLGNIHELWTPDTVENGKAQAH